MTVEQPVENGEGAGTPLEVSDANHTLHAFIANEPLDREISVYWKGRLDPKSLSNWATIVSRSHREVNTFVIDQWDEKKPAPKTYRANNLTAFARDLRGFGDSTVSLSVASGISARPSLYLWGAFSSDQPPREPRGEGEVGLKLGISELAEPRGRSVLAKVIELSSVQRFAVRELDHLLEQLNNAVMRYVAVH